MIRIERLQLNWQFSRPVSSCIIQLDFIYVIHVELQESKSSFYKRAVVWSWPSRKLQFEGQKIAKTWPLFQKNCQKWFFFQKKKNANILVYVLY